MLIVVAFLLKRCYIGLKRDSAGFVLGEVLDLWPY